MAVGSINRDHLEDHRRRALPAVGGGAEMKEPAAGLGDGRGRDDELALGLPLDDQQAVQADVVDITAEGKIAA